MKLKKNSLLVRIWSYLIVFSLLILAFLWIFQVFSLDKYYEWYKTKSIKQLASNIVSNYEDTDEFSDSLDEISMQEDVCIELYKKGSTHYTTNLNRSCVLEKKNSNLTDAKKDFMKSGENSITFKVEDIESYLIYGLKIDNDTYVFLNTLIEPVDSTTTILKKQLLIISFLIIILSSIIAYFISNKLSKPITSLNNSAKSFAKGDYNVIFPNTDIAEISELSDSLNYAKTELSKTDELRKDLIANVSHDLKTPLTMIKAYAEMVRDITYKDKKKREDNLNVIIEEVDRLNLLVSDILDLSSIQSNINKLNIEEFDLIGLISSIINRFNIFTMSEDFTFDFIHEDKELKINADKQKLEQVIYNLIGNAINYSKKEKIVTIKIINKDNTIRVEISDKGAGIDKEEIKYIWDKYYKSERKYKRNMVGTGLGLSIVKNILEIHNYEYGVLSEKNKGTTFYFEIKKSK